MYVEIYNNKIQIEIKKRKGIKFGLHQDSLFEMVWQLNYSNCEFEKLLLIINFIIINLNIHYSSKFVHPYAKTVNEDILRVSFTLFH